jgi:cephalosporin hydroxylase
MSLLNIAKKFPTTKNDHEYIQLYEKYLDSFRHQEINILEIGIDKGYSLNMWREYFTKAKICAIDIIDRNISVPNTDIMIGDQSDYDFLKKITDKYTSFDIIIDDGSHHSKHIIASFKYLFNYLNRDGIYIIEDLQTSYIPRFGGNRFNLNKKNTSMNFLKRLTDSINYEHYDKPFFSNFIFDGSVKSIYFHQNISFVTKGESKKFFFNKIKNNTLIDKIKKIVSYVYS